MGAAASVQPSEPSTVGDQPSEPSTVGDQPPEPSTVGDQPPEPSAPPADRLDVPGPGPAPADEVAPAGSTTRPPAES